MPKQRAVGGLQWAVDWVVRYFELSCADKMNLRGLNQAIPLSIILSELFHNISLHAYPEVEGGDVSVTMQERDDRILEFTITDYGIGLPERVNFSKLKTLGFTVVQTLLKQLNARAEIIKKDDIGFGMHIILLRSDKKGTSQSKKVSAIA